MSRLKRWIIVASVGFLCLIPLFALVAIAGVVSYWGFGVDHVDSSLFGPNFLVLAEAPPVPERQVYGLVAALVPLLLWLCAQVRLFVMFALCASGRALGTATVRHLRAFSLYAALAVLSGFALSGVMRWAAGEFDDAPLWTHLGFSTTHAAVLFMAAIMFVASHIIEEGYDYKRETEEYV
ncbi:DUF2975 domain-containing protein [Parasphingopyxis marina]|uniref:DUF2975 domain-containing protein n=1 Tax=Parasphingopyxis marina TaxID=2761622 RepID=A0A842HXZ2_9SPHN|nr:DUF2975 domain-containing protein [Parasphingopyxis marina]MBC2777323.1 DUF2975 domain-containing protein [Parasphingopyxis marina]